MLIKGPVVLISVDFQQHIQRDDGDTDAHTNDDDALIINKRFVESVWSIGLTIRD